MSGQVGADEAEWTQRNAAARRELADARAALASADSNLPKWSVSGRGSAYEAAMLDQMREDALLPYRARVSAAQARVDALPEEARKAGAQPGWVRGSPKTSASPASRPNRRRVFAPGAFLRRRHEHGHEHVAGACGEPRFSAVGQPYCGPATEGDLVKWWS